MSDILTPEQISNMRESAEFHGYDYVLDSHEARHHSRATKLKPFVEGAFEPTRAMFPPKC